MKPVSRRLSLQVGARAKTGDGGDMLMGLPASSSSLLVFFGWLATFLGGVGVQVRLFGKLGQLELLFGDRLYLDDFGVEALLPDFLCDWLGKLGLAELLVPSYRTQMLPFSPIL